MDYYSFKEEFEKLIAPNFSRPLLPEYLKKNDFQGQAFQLVKEIYDINDIWKRLELSFGNVSLLLTNKFKNIVIGKGNKKTRL